LRESSGDALHYYYSAYPSLSTYDASYKSYGSTPAAFVILTDAALEPSDAQRLLSAVVDETFNCISVDGHMSTNDTVLMLANGAAGNKRLRYGTPAFKTFQRGLDHVTKHLAPG